MNTHPNLTCLVLACGNPLRSDDGVALALADWATRHYQNDPRIRVVAAQQWTPELAFDLAHAHTALFLDCSLALAPGRIVCEPVTPADESVQIATHHLAAPQLLALARSLYGTAPQAALLLTVGAASVELGDTLSPTVQAALPPAQQQLEISIAKLLSS